MSTIADYLKQVQLPDPHSHKGQNGKLLIIGGSELFHAASKWSLDVASKFADMVIYSSVPGNNQLMQQAKSDFWNGIIIPRSEIETYIKEADCVLIGPGMERSEYQLLKLSQEEFKQKISQPPTEEEWNSNTELITAYLLNKYPDKKWVIDAGALQMLHPQLLNSKMIITPHQGELERVQGIVERQQPEGSDKSPFEQLLATQAAIVLKGEVDYVYSNDQVVEVTGGNAGMTKGGTGDVLAGLIAGLYCTQSREVAAVIGSYINKLAGEELFKTVGPYFNASDLAEMVPKILWRELEAAGS